MKDHPFLFTGAMVRKLRDRSKTQTRRVLTRRNSTVLGYNSSVKGFTKWWEEAHWDGAIPQTSGHVLNVRCGGEWENDECWYRVRPRVEGGVDRIWVKETWTLARHMECWVDGVPKEMPERWNLHFRASFGEATINGEPDWWKWRPSIFMPRWASRIILPVTEVRVQRVQDISEDDARAEGAEPVEWSEDFGGAPFDGTSYREGFRELWDSINVKRANGIYSWESNPWVFAYTFPDMEESNGTAAKP